MSQGVNERTVLVNVPPRPYPVAIGAGQLATLGPRLRNHVNGGRVVVITDDNVKPLYAKPLLNSLREAGFEATLKSFHAGEQSKSLRTVARLYDALADAHIDRGCPVIALGGGVVGDVAGFTAATWLRGIPFVQVPTTLEADVDSSVGGKTGVNHVSGKNMIGAFYQPLFVLVDTATLASLTPRDFRAGLAESVKHAVIRDAEFFEWHEANVDRILARDEDVLGRLIERNVEIKAGIVAEDERETTGLRSLLNFGHTVGHAVETAMARRADHWRHGECVAVGMVAAAEISVLSGHMSRGDAERVVAVVERLGLPITAPLKEHREELIRLMNADKKTAAGKIRFAVADGIGRATLDNTIKSQWIHAALDRVCISG